MSQATITDLLLAHNSGREPERLAMKYSAMRKSAFVFLRGSCQLFHHRLAAEGLVPDAPAAWICGDLHMENFGTYASGEGRTEGAKIQFDVNDFDEAILAAHTLDILRLASSVFVGAETIGLDAGRPKEAAYRAITHYLGELAGGRARSIDRQSARGPIGDLIAKLGKRDLAKFVDKRTKRRDGRLVIDVDGDKALALDSRRRTRLAEFCSSLPPPEGRPRAFTFIDAARRIAGTGSLGIERDVILVEGEGAPRHWLLDLKAAHRTALADCVGAQPSYADEARRVVEIQGLFQDATPALLGAHVLDGKAFVLKQMQPSADRLDLAAVASDGDAFDIVIDTMAHLTAWGHLRGSGHRGSADVGMLATSANRMGLADDILKRAAEMARITHADFSAYARAYDDGRFGAVR